MKAAFHKVFLIVALALATAISPCLALMTVRSVTVAEAKEWKVEVRAMPAGQEDVRVEVEFPADGEFKGFRRVDFRMIGDDGKMIAVTSLKEEPGKDGRVQVSFATNRQNLGKIAIWVVTGGGARVGGAFEIKPAAFVDLAKLK